MTLRSRAAVWSIDLQPARSGFLAPGYATFALGMFDPGRNR